mmetsp:Transcript_113547/g.232308  ORF Transcript_113547/g.232308 Transcript_113547/m.232308 type:complete len:191 (+) Transcript_113547:631-1203(+)
MSTTEKKKIHHLDRRLEAYLPIGCIVVTGLAAECIKGTVIILSCEDKMAADEPLLNKATAELVKKVHLAFLLRRRVRMPIIWTRNSQVVIEHRLHESLIEKKKILWQQNVGMNAAACSIAIRRQRCNEARPLSPLFLSLSMMSAPLRISAKNSTKQIKRNVTGMCEMKGLSRNEMARVWLRKFFEIQFAT